LQFAERQYGEAISSARKSLELKPEFPVGLYTLGLILAAQGRYEEAVEAHTKAGDLSPLWKYGLGQTYALAGRKKEALNVAAELEAEGKKWDTAGIAEIYAALGETDKAFEWLETAYEKRHPFLPWIGVNPSYVSLKDDPRFQDLLKRMNLPPLPPKD
jgi:tetratricopeptide (TPR) repeat protein